MPEGFVGSATAERMKRGSHEDLLILGGFLAFNALFRLALLGINEGEYTDGILQIVQFEQPSSFWPPLYTALIWLLGRCGLDGIPAGRLISWASSVLIILPLWYIARRWGGKQTALYAVSLYTVSAMALRWSLRVMTDMTFTLFLLAAIGGLLSIWDGGDAKRGRVGGQEAESRKSRRDGFLLALVTAVSVLAVMTRYQGLLLLPLVLGTLVVLFRRKARGWAIACVSQILWLAMPLWLVRQGFGHFAQVGERASSEWGAALLNYWYVFEMFVYLVPYFITLPVAIFTVLGIVKGRPYVENADAGRPCLPLGLASLYLALGILIAQSVFQSFQSRYLLPLLPFGLVYAGAGMAWMERQGQKQGTWGRRTVLAISGATFIWSLVFALAVVFLQRGAFGDLFAAGAHIRSLNLPPQTRLYTNETYKPGMEGIKLSYCSGRKAELIPGFSGPTGSSNERMAPGSILALHSAYSGGFAGQAHLVRTLQDEWGYRLRPLPNGTFRSSLIPLLPDIMEEPLTHQNPLAWLLRYQRQDFQTQLFVVVQ